MYRTRKISNSRDSQLLAIAGLIGGFLFAVQLNLHEVLRVDRLQHTLVSATLFLSLYMLFSKQRWGFVYAIVGSLTIGGLKEIWDHQAQNFDMVANGLGVFVGFALLIVYLGIFKQSVGDGQKRRY